MKMFWLNWPFSVHLKILQLTKINFVIWIKIFICYCLTQIINVLLITFIMTRYLYIYPSFFELSVIWYLSVQISFTVERSTIPRLNSWWPFMPVELIVKRWFLLVNQTLKTFKIFVHTMLSELWILFHALPSWMDS